MEDSKLKYIAKTAIGFTLFAGIGWAFALPLFFDEPYWTNAQCNLWYLPIWLVGGAIMGALTWTDNIIGIEKQRKEQGLCTNCGYDIKNSGVEICPECGAPAGKD